MRAIIVKIEQNLFNEDTQGFKKKAGLDEVTRTKPAKGLEC